MADPGTGRPHARRGMAAACGRTITRTARPGRGVPGVFLGRPFVLVLAACLAMAASAAKGEPATAPLEIAGCRPPPAPFAPARERDLAIETPAGTLRGTLAGPDGAPPRALAVLLHGYTGTRNEIPVAGGEGMFARTARAFAARGIASLRIDFIGSGRSDGTWADTRFSGQARDVGVAVDALRGAFSATGGAGAPPLGLLGYSQGGLVALRAAARGGTAAGDVDRVVLWNPVLDPMATYGVIFGRETIRAAARAHEAAAGAPEGAAPAPPFGETRLRPGFFAELAAADPIADAATVAAPLLFVTGRRDPLVEQGAALAGRARARRRAPSVVLDLDAGHDLGALREPALLDAVIACSAAFLLSGPAAVGAGDAGGAIGEPGTNDAGAVGAR